MQGRLIIPLSFLIIQPSIKFKLMVLKNLSN